MLRKDLKVGDIFCYVDSTNQFIVSETNEGSRPIFGKMTHPSTSRTCAPSSEVVLVPQTEQTPSIVDPPHYRYLTPEPIDVIEAWNLDRYLSNVVKYISRAGEKPGAAEIDDLKKARRWLTRKINKLEGRATWEYKD